MSICSNQGTTINCTSMRERSPLLWCEVMAGFTATKSNGIALGWVCVDGCTKLVMARQPDSINSGWSSVEQTSLVELYEKCSTSNGQNKITNKLQRPLLKNFFFRNYSSK